MIMGVGGEISSPGLTEVLAVVDEQGPADRGERLVWLRRLIDLLELRFSEAVDAFDSECPEWGGRRDPLTAIEWLRDECHMAGGAAADRLRVGGQSQRLPGAREALARGEIGFAHLSLMAGVAEAAEGCDARFLEAPLLARALAETPGRFRKTCEHARHAQDPRSYSREQEQAAQERFLDLSSQDNGSLWLRGWLEPEGASILRSALEPLARPGEAGDDRRREQRLADALVEALGERQETELLVTTSVETLLGLQGSPAAETEWGGLLSSRTVARQACSGVLRRLLLGNHSVVIEAGRRQRLVSPQARRALGGRDRHCVWPGCDRPARWCEAHHLKPWSRGGGTDLGQLVLVCRLCRRRHNRHYAEVALMSRWSSERVRLSA